MAEEVSRAARAVREGLDALRLRASSWGAPRPRFWIDERTTKSCFECGVAFSLVTRKHHCRACGRVFCQKCSSHALPPRDDPEGPPERACDVCFASHADAAEPLRASTSSAKKRVSARSPRVPDPALSRVASERLAGSSPTSSVSSRPASASASRRASTGPAGSADDSDSDSESDEDASESDASDDDASGDADAKRVSDANLSDGAADVRTRRGARHRSASPLETRWTHKTPRALDRSETGTETEAEAETPSERPARRTSPRRYRAGKPAYAAHAAHAAALVDETMWAPPPPGLEPHRMRSTAGSTLSDAPVNAAILGLAARFLRRDARSSSEATASSSESKNETDALVDTWTRFVAALALECARAVEPSRFAFSETSKSPSGSDPRRKPDDARRDRYDMDPLSYVSIRRAAAGAPSSSSLARDAWSLRRNVADRRMAKRRGVVSSTSAETLARRHFPDPTHPRDPRDEFSAATEFSAREPRTATFHPEPRSNDDDDGDDGDASPAVRVALLGGALEYQRATYAPRLASFSTLLDQEHEHLRASAARALVSKPDVALVERTVARFARDLFLERGVSLAIGVGLEELRRLAFRFAPSEYSWSRSALAADGGAVRGTCAGWSVETLEETLCDDDDETETETHARRSVSPTTTSYMTFHGLTPGSGCVLTLRGGSTSALAAVESATKKSARAAYHLDRVAAFVKTAASSHVGQSSKKNARQAKVDRFVDALLQKSVETEFTNATVQIVSRAFCPARVASVACDPPVGFRSTFSEKKLDTDKIPFLEIVPYGPEDLPLGAALAQAVRAERGLTECQHAKCGEHPAAHVRVFYVAGGKVTLRARRREKHEKNFSNQKEKEEKDFLDADGGTIYGTWTYWSRCRSCLPEETRTDTFSFATREEHGDAKSHFPFATPARVSASPVAAPKRALELSLARFLELVGADVPEAVFDGLDASRLDGECVHASPRDRAHYFASALGTVCFAFDETSPLALVVSPTRDSPSSARFDARDSAAERKTASSARFDARCAAAAAALRSDAYEAAMAAFGSFPTRDDDVSRLFEKTVSSDVASVASEHVVVAELGVTAYFARQFRQARSAWWNGSRRRMTQNDDSTSAEDDEDVEAVFANALSQCAYWDVGARGGKSRAFFARSNDGRFVAKQVSKTELECLLSADFAAAYFSRVSANREKNASGSGSRLDSLLAATLGAFSVAPSKLLSRRDESNAPIGAGAFDFVVLENAFFGVGDISSLNLRVYDLKGSLRGRYAVGFANDGAETKRDANDSVTREYASSSSSSEKEKEKDAVVLMDGNLAETCAIEPLLITRESFVSLERAIRADVAFLAARNVMDYSLLVGIPLDVDKNPGDASGRAPRRAVVKIIDYLRMYTWDKQIESAVKSGVLSGEEAPTVLSPEKYARRFRRATRRYFLAVPDDLLRESFEK